MLSQLNKLKIKETNKKLYYPRKFKKQINMTLSDFLVRELYNKGVRHVFEVSGGMIANIINSFYNFTFSNYFKKVKDTINN